MGKPKNNLGLSQEEVNELLYEENVLDENSNEIYEFVSKELFDSDTEKSSVTYNIIIKEVKSGKFFKARLGKSPWYLQAEDNADRNWKEVKPKNKTITVYE